MAPRKILTRLQTYKKNIKPDLSKHCLGTLIVEDSEKLFNGPACVEAIRDILAQNNTKCLGEQLHEFPNNSFTLLVTLAESHISIHTWPERLAVQLDVFLCNYVHDNSEKCENIYNDIVAYFGAKETNTTILQRL